MSGLDYIVVAVYLAAVLLVGIAASRGQRDTEGYLMGGRSIPWLAGAASLVATAISAKSLVGLPGLTYGGDFTYLQMYLVAPLAAYLVSVSLLPGFTRLRITSAYEFLGRRFGPRVRSLASLMFQVETAVILGTVVAAPALVISESTGFSFNLSVVILLAATLLYTAIGGIKAVVWTDVLQFFIFSAVPVMLAWYAVATVEGGAAAIWRQAQAHGKLRLFNFSPDLTVEVTFWSALVSMLFWHGSNYGSNQVLVQRYMTAPSQRDCRRTMLFGSAATLVLWAGFLMIGVLLYASNQLQPGVVPPGTAPDRVFPAFAMSTLPSGMRGAFLAAVLAAAMSTLSGMLNSMGTVTLLDVWKLHFDDGAGEMTWLRRARAITVIWGLFSFVTALFVLKFGTVITAGIKLGSILSGALLGMFLLGAFARRAVPAGVVAGAAAGCLAVCLVMAFTGISWSWYCGIGTVVTVAAGYAVSICLTERPRTAAVRCGE